MNKHQLCVGLLFAAGTLWAATAAVDRNTYRDEVKYLASPELKGRGDGTPELDKAAEFLASKFASFHLQPLSGTSYYQDFALTTHAHLGKHNALSTQTSSKRRRLRIESDFEPYSFSSSGEASGPVVFVGFGITAPEFQYDDYAGIDVTGKIVLMLRHEPSENADGPFFNGREFTIHAQLSSKATNAKQHGAAAVLLVDDLGNHPKEEDRVARFSQLSGPANAGIPFVQITVEAANKMLAGSKTTVARAQSGIDQSHKPASFAVAGDAQASLRTELVRDQRTVHNVGGYLPGETDEYVVIGAHYDHLGLGEQFSMAPSSAGTIHPGADDNASGVAGVLELARSFSAGPKQRRGLLFLTFAGEELGLLGSSYYVQHPELPLDKAVAMINMDMIGRIQRNRVYVGGIGTGSTFRTLVDEVRPSYNFELDVAQQALNGSSDHTSFQTHQIPILFFFSGLHGDYHKPSDTWDKIRVDEAVKLLALVSDLTTRLANDPGRPEFVRLPAPEQEPGSNPTSGSSGYGPYFGSVPDFEEIPAGVRFADVTAGSPAGKAGLRAGDVLVEFGGKKIQNLYDFTYSLRAHQPGDVVKVRVLRDGTPVEVEVTLTRRK